MTRCVVKSEIKPTGRYNENTQVSNGVNPQYFTTIVIDQIPTCLFIGLAWTNAGAHIFPDI